MRTEEDRIGAEGIGWWLRPDDLVTERPGLSMSAGQISQSEGITIPTPVFAALVAGALGVFFGPALLSLSAGGRDYLDRAAKGKFGS